MNNKLTFITGNAGKFAEAVSIIPGLVQKDIDLPEIQEIDPKKVIEAKLDEAYKIEKGEYIVEDSSLCMDALGGLPGPLIKWFMKTIDTDGIASLAELKENAHAEAVCMIGYINEHGEKQFFEGRIKGTVVSSRGTRGFGWDTIFVPEGHNKTFAEMSQEEKNEVSMRRIALDQLRIFLGN